MNDSRLAARQNARLNGSTALIADQSIAIAIRYKGSQVSATATVVSATGITLKHGALGAEVVDTTVGASANGVVDFATDTTIAAVVDRINASGNWTASIVDALATDSMASSTMLARSETTLSPVRTQVLPLYWDTSAHLSFDYRISARRLNFNRRRAGYQAVLKEVRALADISSGTLTLFVYDVDPRTRVATLRATMAGTDNVETLYQVGNGMGEVRSEWNNDLLIRYVGSANLPDTSGYLRVSGYIE